MGRKKYNKLIRDKIPEIIRANKAVPKVSVLKDEEFKEELKEKLVEEAQELLGTKSQEDILNELSDVAQLVESIAINNGLSMGDIEKKKKEKAKQRGVFKKKLFLKYVDE